MFDKNRFSRAAKTTTGVMGMLFWSWPIAILAWSALIVLPAVVAHLITASYWMALGAAIFIPKLVSSGVFLVSYLVTKPKPP